MIIHRYVFREIAGPTLLGLLVYTCIMVVKHFFNLAAAWVDRIFTTADVFRQLAYLMPSILVLTIPMSVLLGILIGFSRLSADSEITALRANGVSYYRLLAPTALLAVLGWAASGAVYLWAVPWANTRVVEEGMEAQRRADLNRQVQPGAWVRLDEAAVFARGVDNADPREPWLLDVDVLLTYPGQPFREHWRAKRARIERILSGEDRGRLAFQLRDVRITRWRIDQPEGNIQISSAEVGDRLGPERPLPTIAGVTLRAASKNPRLQRVDELRASLAALDEMDRLDEMARTEPRRAAELRSELGQWVIPQRRESVRLDTLMEIHKKFSIPAACLVFALAGMPLGIATRRGGRPASFLVSLGIIALWYLIFSATDAWVHVSRLEPAVGAWLPDVVLAVIGIYLLVRLRRQQRMSAYRVLHDTLLLGSLVLLLFVGVFLSAWLAQPAELRPEFPLWPPVAAAAAAAAWGLVHLLRDPLSGLLERLGEAVRRPFVRVQRVRDAVGVRQLGATPGAGPAGDPPVPTGGERRAPLGRLLDGVRGVSIFALFGVLVLGAVDVVTEPEGWQAGLFALATAWEGGVVLLLLALLAALQAAGARTLRVLSWWVLSTYARTLALVLASLLLLYGVFTYVELADSILRNEPPVAVVAGFYWNLLPRMLMDTTPIAAMVSALVVFGIMTRYNETAALTCCGVSVFRVVLPVIFVGLLVSGATFMLHDWVLPRANVRATELRDVIKGRPRGARASLGRGNAVAEGGRALYQYDRYVVPETLDGQGSPHLLGLTVLRLDDTGRTREIQRAADAVWTGDSWTLRSGWLARIGQDHQVTVTAIESTTDARLESPRYFAAERDDPSLMSYPEFRRHVEQQEASGYPTDQLRVQLHGKLALPAGSFVLLLVGLPFAFTTGRRGALYGIGIAVILVIAWYAAQALFTSLGSAGYLPPAVAAWAPNALFGLAGMYLMLHVRT